ncbi:hypothetical protein V8C42DRAFT_335204 [Trichoderma barbatum]
MVKRKFGSNPPLPRKKAKVAQLHETIDNTACDLLAIPSPPLSQMTYTQRQKRKRIELSQIDSHDEPSAKRARTSRSPSEATSCSPSSSPEPWPSIGYKPEEEKEPSPLVEEFYKSCVETEVACSCRPHIIYRNPLPSPVPSERDAAENEAIEHAMVHTNPQTRKFASKSQRISYPKPQEASLSSPSSSRGNNKRSRRRIVRGSPAPSHPEQLRKQRRKKKNDNHNGLRDEKPLPKVENFLQSKRSSRQDPECELWYLSDNGTACAVTSIGR